LEGRCFIQLCCRCKRWIPIHKDNREGGQVKEDNFPPPEK
jgi:hypothetical protein